MNDSLKELQNRIQEVEKQNKARLLSSLSLFAALQGYRTAILITKAPDQSMMIGYFNWKQLKEIADKYGGGIGSEYVRALEKINPDKEVLLITPGNPPHAVSSEDWDAAVKQMQQDLA